MFQKISIKRAKYICFFTILFLLLILFNASSFGMHYYENLDFVTRDRHS